MTTDLVDRLRARRVAVRSVGDYDGPSSVPDRLCQEAADRLESLTKPLSDAKVVEIAEQHRMASSVIGRHESGAAFIAAAARAHTDRAYLLSDRETLIRERDEARAAALEEAAKVADNWINAFGDRKPVVIDAQTWATDAVRDIADAIRSMKGE